MSRYTYDKTSKELDIIAGVPAMDGTPVKDSVKPITSGGVYDALDPMLNELGAKNLLNIPSNRVPVTAYGVTVQKNDDGSLNVSGTNPDATRHGITLIKRELDEGSDLEVGTRYTLNGVKSTDDCFLQIGGIDSDGTYTIWGETGSEEGFTFTATTSKYHVYLILPANGSVDTTIYPMIRLASITNSTYVPYARSNQELTGEVEPMLNVLGAKNLLPNTATTQTINGITFTINDNGSVTVNGTATNTTSINLCTNLTLPKGKYLLSGGYSDDVRVDKAINDSNYGYSKGDEIEIDLNETDVISYVRVTVVENTEVSNVTVYPMIRPESIKDDTYVPYAMTNRELTVVEAWKSLPVSQANCRVDYRKVGSRKVQVHLRLASASLVTTTWATLGTLPSGYRPPFEILKSVYANPATSACLNCYISTNGTVGAMGISADGDTLIEYET